MNTSGQNSSTPVAPTVPEAPIESRTFNTPGAEWEGIRLLGEGGLGQVFLVRNMRTHRLAAIKCMLPELRKNQSLCRRLIKEGNAGMAFCHPFALQIFDVGELEDGSPFLLMEYLSQGQELDKIINAYGAIPPRAACQIVRQVSLYLRALHEHVRGFLHRDIKESNIWVFPDGTIKVMDLGLVKELVAAKPVNGKRSQKSMVLTSLQAVIGTPKYMSPEQKGAGEVDARADIYALGVTLWSLLCMDEIPDNMHLLETPDHADLKKIPKPLRSVISGAVRRFAHERAYATDEDFTRALDEAAARLPPDRSEHFWTTVRFPEGPPVAGRTIVADISGPQIEDLDGELGDEQIEELSELSLPTAAPYRSKFPRVIASVIAVVLLIAIGGSYKMLSNSTSAPQTEITPPVAIVAVSSTPIAPPIAVTPTVAPVPIASTPTKVEAKTVPKVKPTTVTPTAQVIPTHIDPPVGSSTMPMGTVTVRPAPVGFRLTGSNGTYTAGSVPPGTYKVQAKFAESDSWTTLSKTITVVDGQTVRFTCDLVMQTCR